MDTRKDMDKNPGKDMDKDMDKDSEEAIGLADRIDRNRLASHIDKKIALRESDEMFHKNIHTELKSIDVQDLKQYVSNMSLGFDVMILSICGDLNIGTILRTSHMFGVRKFIVYGKKQFDTRSTVGSLKYTEVERIFGLKDRDRDEKKILSTTDRIICPTTMYTYLTQNNLVPVLVEQHSKAKYLDNLNWTEVEHIANVSDISSTDKTESKKFCFIFGNEGDGISSDVIEKCLTIEGSFVLSIRQMGVLRSLNVSAAAAIVIYNYYEHRMAQRIGYLNI
jgi:tRNA G18 (ribose-2'-O)-methylase SpoU